MKRSFMKEAVSMRNSWTIYKNDLRSLSRNWVALILVGGLTFLPSLYAWLNIYASWDPYAQTGQLPVAVVNEDTGAMIRQQRIDVGGQLIDSLKKNKDMDWHFTTRQQAMNGVEYGDYFAVLFIPKDFSEKLGTVVSGNPQRAEIDYYVNEKLNSIAPKITEKGASVVVDKVSSQFVATVNEVIFNLFNTLGVEIQNELPDIERFENYIFDIEKKLPDIYNTLTGTQNDVKSAQSLMQKAHGMIPSVKQSVTEGLGTIDSTLTFLHKAETRLDELSPSIKKDLDKASKISNDVNDFLQNVNTVALDFTELDATKQRIDERMTEAITLVATVQDDLEWLQQLASSAVTDEGANEGNGTNVARHERLVTAIERTGDLKRLMEETQSNARNLNDLLGGKEEQLKQTLKDLQEITENTRVNLAQFVKEYKQTIEPTVLAETKRAKGTLQQGRSTLLQVQSTLPEVERILNNTSANVTKGQQTLDKVLGEYPYVSEKVKLMANRIRKVQDETDLHEIIRLLQNDPQAERSFFEQPITMQEHKLFKIKNYGTGMTPFYTVLSIWVGCLLLISLLSTDAEHRLDAKPRQVYLGKLMTFMTIGLLQTAIITFGDLFLLKVETQSPVLFVLFGLLISVVFMLIVYTLVSLFGDVGKAMAIVMLVLQIAGSGGTYPVVLLPSFFQWINPALPFTYAIDLMREAVGGIVWQRATTDIIFLAITGTVFMLIGFFLKKVINRKTHQLLEKSRESGLFH
ncbi:YhgE/Pip domain-containing protein [Sporosarcina oncorhynchi]|uniref:YhgE/Pip domain-containing protein n=1 Tax=Sporosarcina oncorhynchi TaxID=3056444 RepID=A0ABZ0L4Z3_9BACL|nr:YhgE/Pip domain-containing protein [Sporosarcina sp. T2O-4]WOV87013.1 YhgE/Pip domain-containing protein [Sporosarcina sp. T2O-4]